MTDDFHLFPAADGDGPAVDADVALITAFLARELSHIQIVAVEDRLAMDRAFRDKVQPIIEAWALPAANVAGVGRSAPPTSLTRAEIDAGWQRHLSQSSHMDTRASRPAVAALEAHTQRRKSMTRIAAMIATIVTPIVVSAQLVVYAAKHADAPGHKVARAIVPPSMRAPLPAEPAPIVQPAQRGETLPDAEGPPARMLTLPPQKVQRGAPVAGLSLAAAETTVVGRAPGAQEAARQKPDRARIAALARPHQSALVRGDTAAEYIVMVLDASDKYLWSTIGSGNLTIEVGGDPRKPAERNAFTREHQLEYSGAGGPVGRGGMLGQGQVRQILPTQGQQRVVGDTARRVQVDSLTKRVVHRESLAVIYRRMADTVAAGSGRGGRGGGGTGARGAGGDTLGDQFRRAMIVTLPIDGPIGGARVGGAGGGGAGGARGGRGGPVDTMPGVYKAGWAGTRYGSLMNQASGLQEPRSGESGIQGVLSGWVTSAETYRFAAGEPAPRTLNIMVVHLKAGTVWKGR
jgi:hypothetical protein